MPYAPRKRPRKPSFRRDTRGATAVEFAFVAPVLCFALLSIVEIGMLGMMSSGLDNAVIEAARRIRTGRDDGATSAATFEDEVCATLGGDVSACHTRLVISVQKYSKFFDATATVDTPPAGAFDKGGPGDIIIVKADYVWPLMTPFLVTAFGRSGPMSVTLGSRIAFKNEPYT
ncbi:TadE/TadG family type IV pilus assembly protein [Phenylobacterium sp.]|uniref:TadE/TadG family type IV pilus assembly protein n=1 Tax=Phenylobacterium sp. TaxID=1871053 RepID=UPI0025DE7319|nr:TadE/TadG family type IV pilus assembly protein [Phenylobacterium sp.]